MSLRINDEAPNFTAQTTQGNINFHDWINKIDNSQETKSVLSKDKKNNRQKNDFGNAIFFYFSPCWPVQ